MELTNEQQETIDLLLAERVNLGIKKGRIQCLMELLDYAKELHEQGKPNEALMATKCLERLSNKSGEIK